MLKPIEKFYCDTIPFKPYGRVLALGMFDGLHVGHLDIIKKTVKLAKTSNLTSCVQTFTGLNKNDAGLLYTIDERLEILESLGVDEVLVLNFPEIKDMSPDEYCRDILKLRAGACAIVMGFDYTFGAKGAGDTNFMTDFAANEGIGIRVVNEHKLGDAERKISTTWMREALAEGDVRLAREMCGGRPYSYSGYVVHGKMLGRRLGFPTANLNIPEEKFTVRRGVYASRVIIGNQSYYGVSNIGRRPTVEAAHSDVIETYIFDFDEDIYGVKIKTELLEFLRPEKAFANEQELARAVEENKSQAREYLKAQGFI